MYHFCASRRSQSPPRGLHQHDPCFCRPSQRARGTGGKRRSASRGRTPKQSRRQGARGRSRLPAKLDPKCGAVDAPAKIARDPVARLPGVPQGPHAPGAVTARADRMQPRSAKSQNPKGSRRSTAVSRVISVGAFRSGLNNCESFNVAKQRKRPVGERNPRHAKGYCGSPHIRRAEHPNQLNAILIGFAHSLCGHCSRPHLARPCTLRLGRLSAANRLRRYHGPSKRPCAPPSFSAMVREARKQSKANIGDFSSKERKAILSQSRAQWSAVARSQVSMAFGVRGPCFVTSSACASSSHAIGIAASMIRAGSVDTAIAGGTEACLTEGSLMAWDAMKILSRTKCRPFAKGRDGLVISEGAGILNSGIGRSCAIERRCSRN